MHLARQASLLLSFWLVAERSSYAIDILAKIQIKEDNLVATFGDKEIEFCPSENIQKLKLLSGMVLLFWGKYQIDPDGKKCFQPESYSVKDISESPLFLAG